MSQSETNRLRVLLVEDEPLVLRAMKRQMSVQPWELMAVQTAEDGLEQVAQHGVDVVLTDVGLPGMDGITMLTKIKKSHPATVRLVHSATRNMTASLRAAGCVHRFYAKGIDSLRDVVKMVLDGIEMTSAFESGSIASTLATGASSLAITPRIYQQLRTALSDPDRSMAEIAAIVEQSPAVSAKVLQLSNSSFFGTSRQTSSVTQALCTLGLRVTSELVLASELFCTLETCPFLDAEAFQEHSLEVAQLAGRISGDPDAFVAGLLHEVGVLLVASEAPDRLAAVVTAHQQGMDLMAAEERHIGATHPSLGAYLLHLWGLPSTVVEAVRHHHHDGPLVSDDLASSLRIADVMACRARGYDDPFLGCHTDLGELPMAAFLNKIDGWDH